MNARPYQLDALNSVRTACAGPVKPRGIIAIPTGAGKGWLAGLLPDAMGAEHALFMAHREELIDQLVGHIQRAMPDARIGVERAEEHARPMHNIVVASIPTLVARECRRLHRLGKDRFGGLVTDECHHSCADGYMKVYQHFGLLDDQKKKVPSPTIPHIGLTATPGRGDGVGLHNAFDSILYQYSLQHAIKDGWLVPIHAFTIFTGVSLDKVRTVAGDYVEKELARAVATEERNAAVFDACQNHCQCLKTLIFCVNVQHAVEMAEFFAERDIHARHIAGTMSGEDRKEALQWFKSTPGAVLTNCQIATEGVDIPSIEAVVLARPTKSKTLFAQMLGRGTRLAEGAHDYSESVVMGKDKLILLDVTDTTSRIGAEAVNIADIWGLPIRDKELKGESLEDAEEFQRKFLEDQQRDKVKTVSKFVNLFAAPPAGSIPSNATLPWLYLSDTELRLMLPDSEQVRLVTNTLDQWCVESLLEQQWIPAGEPQSEKSEACRIAEQYVHALRPDAINLLRWKASGSKKKPSPAALQYAKRLAKRIGIPQGEIDAIQTATELSDAIDRMKLQGGDKPSNAQLWLAKRLGIPEPEKMTGSQLGKAISKAKAAQEEAASEEMVSVGADEGDAPF